MPLYEYKCSECEHTFEEILKIADVARPLAEPCPNCGELKINRHWSEPTAMSYGSANLKDKRPEWFKDRLKKIASFTPRHNMDI